MLLRSRTMVVCLAELSLISFICFLVGRSSDVFFFRHRSLHLSLLVNSSHLEAFPDFPLYLAKGSYSSVVLLVVSTGVKCGISNGLEGEGSVAGMVV